MQNTLENPMVTGQATPRVFSDPFEFGTNTAARLVNDVVEEIEDTLESTLSRLEMYKKVEKDEDGTTHIHTSGAIFECQKAIKDLKELLKHAKDTRKYAL